MEDKKLRRIGTILYWMSIVFAASTLLKAYIDKSKVLPGVNIRLGFLGWVIVCSLKFIGLYYMTLKYLPS